MSRGRGRGVKEILNALKAEDEKPSTSTFKNNARVPEENASYHKGSISGRSVSRSSEFSRNRDVGENLKNDEEDEAFNPNDTISIPETRSQKEQCSILSIKPSSSDSGFKSSNSRTKNFMEILNHFQNSKLDIEEKEKQIDNKTAPSAPVVRVPIKRLGESGHKVTVTSNYLRLTVKPERSAFEYHVEYNPAVEHKAFRISMLKEGMADLGHKSIMFDGSTLYLPKKLPNKTTAFIKHQNNNNMEVTIMVYFVKERKLSDMRQLYNILFKRIMNVLKYVKIGKDVYDPKQKILVPEYKLQLWPGYILRVDEYEDGLMLVLDPTHKTLREETVLDQIKILARNGGTEHSITSTLASQTVLTLYSCKLYTIHDIDFKQNPKSTFVKNNGEVISYVDYFKNTYDVEITDLEQPLLISKNTERLSRPQMDKLVEDRMISLIPELCNLSGITDEMRKNFELMKYLATASKTHPNQRYQLLKSYIENVNNCPEAVAILDEWGLSLDNSPVALDARVLPSEQISFNNNRVVHNRSDWTRDSSILPVITPVDITDWIILYTPRDKRCVEEFAKCILRCGSASGINVAQPKLIMLQSDRIEHYTSTIRRELHSQLQLVLCVCPTNRDDRYSAIKKVCCVENPIPSQVVNSVTISKPQKLRAIAQRVLLQINCKLGGSLWTVRIPYKKPLVVGMDVFHSKTTGVQSVLGFVASYNDKLTKWYSRVCFQNKNQEIADKMRACFLDALRLYNKTNDTLPDRIIVYRDGVSDGQLSYCETFEIPQLESCFSEIAQGYSPTFTFIVVQKRNNIRLFSKDKSSRDTFDNPQVGLVIDNSITRRYLYDFYVVSHQARQNTLRPTHYIVLKDTADTEPDKLQIFTFKMCHLYFNWPGSIRVPAPCQYAHKLASLIGASVKKEHDIRLATNLFFL